MADKRRLEEIKSRIKSGFGCLRHFLRDALDPNDKCVVEDIKLLESDISYLIKQAERVQELEEENRRIRQMKYHEAYEQGKFDTNMKVWYEIPKLEQQNKRYREAIEETLQAMGMVDRQKYGSKLEKALKGE